MTAELYFTSIVVEHNLSFASSDHFTKLSKVMFPDSQIAKNFSCGRTKTKAIVTHALAPAADSLVREACVRALSVSYVMGVTISWTRSILL